MSISHATAPLPLIIIVSQLSISDDGLVMSVGAYRTLSLRWFTLLVVAHPLMHPGEALGRGAVFFFQRNGADWTKAPTLVKKYAPTTGKLPDQHRYSSQRGVLTVVDLQPLPPTSGAQVIRNTTPTTRLSAQSMPTATTVKSWR